MRERERAETWATVLRVFHNWASGHFRGAADAEDIVGETLLRMIAHFGPLPSQPIPLLVAWSKTTAVRVFVDSLRVRKRRRTELRANLDQSTAPAIPDSIHTAGQRLRAKLAIALEKPMAAKQRQVLLLMAEGTTDNESLAKQLSLSTRTIERYRQNLLRMFD